MEPTPSSSSSMLDRDINQFVELNLQKQQVCDSPGCDVQ